MTEAEWETGEDPAKMVSWLTANAMFGGSRCPLATDRKLRLYCLAAAMLGKSPAYMQGIYGETDLSDGVSSRSVVPVTWAENWSKARLDNVGDPTLKVRAAILRDLIGNPFRSLPLWRHEKKPGLGPIHDPRTDRVTPEVLAVATATYEERRPDGTLQPDRLAVLSDALEEAGCGEERCASCHGEKGSWQPDQGWRDKWVTCGQCDGRGSWPSALLAHLRSPGPHYRGCWVVDLILDKD